jgi:hypothetical protein
VGDSEQATAVRIEDERDLADAARALGLDGVLRCIVLVGGADRMSDDELERAEGIFTQALIPLAERSCAAIVDGGTDAGVMRLAGLARARAGASFPLVGTVVAALVDSGEGEEDARLEPNHSHFVFVPGATWGDEVPWLSRLASALSGASSPSWSTVATSPGMTSSRACRRTDPSSS